MGNDIMKLLFDVMKLMTKYNQLKIAVSVTFFIVCNHPISEFSLILTWWPKSTRVTQCYPGTLAHSVDGDSISTDLLITLAAHPVIRCYSYCWVMVYI